MAQSPVVKRVKAYPFPATLEQQGQKKPVEVIFLNQNGVIADLKGTIVKVGDHIPIHFEIPVLKHAVSTVVRVFKTYDKAVDPKSHVIARVAELYFEQLTEHQRNCIHSFMTTIGQAK